MRHGRTTRGLAVRGFTLVEMAITLTVLAVCLGLGLPAFTAAMERADRANAYHLVTASLMSARSAAISRGEFVTICPSRDGLTCRKDSVWDQGWIMFLDPEKHGAPANADAVLRQIDPLGDSIAARSTRRRIRYRPNGQATGTNLSVWLCNRNDGRELGRVAISNTGRARSEHEKDRTTPCRFALSG